MKLKEWLKKEKISAVKLAKMLDVHPQTIYSYIAGTRYPKYEMIKNIQRISNGDVTMGDLLPSKKLCKYCANCKNHI